MVHSNFNIQSRRLSDGRYVYCPASGNPIVITPGKDVPEEIIIVLDQLDHGEALEERYESRQRCRSTEAAKRKSRDSNDDFNVDPIENIPDASADIFHQLFPRIKPTPMRIQKLREYMDRLTDEQRDFIYDFYGMQMTVEEIAQRDGVTHQAMFTGIGCIIRTMRTELPHAPSTTRMALDPIMVSGINTSGHSHRQTAIIAMIRIIAIAKACGTISFPKGQVGMTAKARRDGSVLTTILVAILTIRRSISIIAI